MEKFCRSMTTLYRLPKISHLNLRLNQPTISTTLTNTYIAEHVSCWNQHISVRHYNSQKPPSGPGLSGARIYGAGKQDNVGDEQPTSIVDILEREIQDESAELSQHLSTDQFPGFNVETDGSDVKLTKQAGGATVTIRFTVSSSLSEWSNEQQGQQQDPNKQDAEYLNSTLVSMPEFQVQISKKNQTLELSCYFEEMESDEETGEPYSADPVFSIDELVLYEGEPKETEFSVSADYFQEDLQAALMKYLEEYGINEEFSKNLVSFATSYEKKQYIGLMRRLKSFVSK